MAKLSDVLDAIKQVESGGNPNARSPAGAMGAYQFMPATAREFGLKNPYDEKEARGAAERKISGLLSEYDGDLSKALAAYNMGQGNLKKVKGDYTRVPETRNYVAKIGKILGGLSPISDANAADEWDQFPDAEPAQASAKPEDWDQFPDAEPQQAEQAQPQQYDPTEGMSGGDKFLAGVGKTFVDVGKGAGQLARSAMPDSLADKIGLPNRQDIDESKRLDAPLMDTGAAKAGSVVGGLAAFLPTAFIPGANTATGAALAGAGYGALQPVGEEDSRLVNTGLGGALGLGGKYLGDAAAKGASKWLANRQAAADAKQLANSVKDATTKSAQEAGYVIPPTQVNPSATNRALEGLSGKITTAQNASAKNQSVTDAIVRRELGLGESEPITKEALNGIRKAAGQEYEAIKGAGKITADPEYTQALDDIVSKYSGAEKDFPELASAEVQKVTDAIRKPEFDSSSAIDALAVIREKADKAFASGDKGLGTAYKKAAGAMEDLIERHLQQSGDDAMLGAFREARKTIAKTYTVEKALNGSSGNVSAKALAAQLKKGKPLSGELKLAAQFAEAYPKAAQDVAQMGSLPQVSPLDYALAAMTGVGGAAMGNPGVAAAGLSRPIARALILSKPYQVLMAQTEKYGAGTAPKLADLLLNNKAAPQIARALGPSIYAAQK